MFARVSCQFVDAMSFCPGSSGPGEGLEEYYENMQSAWAGVQPSPFIVNHPYCTGPFPPAAILTPISLPDSSTFANTRPSPVLSHHSQEYQYQSIGESVPQHGLGITAPFPSNFPGTATAGLDFSQEGIEYGISEAGQSLQHHRAKRARRTHRNAPPARETPITILPDPEGLQRLEQERRQSQVESHPLQRPRAPGRGRRDPQAEEEDAYVEGLREQNMAWKVIREMFRERFNKDASEARLQMRMLRRRKERLARWDENDIQLLIRAHDEWEKEKYRWIAQRMKELGAERTHTAQQCEAQLRILESTHSRERSSAAPTRIPDPQHRRKRAKRTAGSMEL